MELKTRDAAKALGISLQTLHRYRRRGCPHRKSGRANLWDIDKVKEWRIAEGIEERREAQVDAAVRSSDRRVERERNQARRSLALAKKAEAALQADAALPSLGISERIQEARTYDELAELARWVAALVGSGELQPTRANSIVKLLQEARQNLTADLQQPDATDDDDGLILCCEDAAEVARIFEGIVSDDRRASVLAHCKAAAAIDLEEHPNVDPGEDD